MKGEKKKKKPARICRKSSNAGKLENLDKYVLSKTNQHFAQMIGDT